ncbi:MAG: hypothetical protein WB507_07960 [Solirubrobacterales bacterium]
MPLDRRQKWRLTVRHASDVEHEEFDDLDTAIGEMRRRAEAVRAEGPLPPSSALRSFEPEDQVHARLQISGRGLLRRPTAGIDVRGDGTLVAFRGTLAREQLKPEAGTTPFDAVRETLLGRAR